MEIYPNNYCSSNAMYLLQIKVPAPCKYSSVKQLQQYSCSFSSSSFNSSSNSSGSSFSSISSISSSKKQ